MIAMWKTLLLPILLLASLVTSLPPQPQYSSSRCPSQCKCDQMVIQCNNLDIKKFGTKVYNLKVVNPEEALILDENVFVKMGINDVQTIFIENARITEIHENAFAGLESLHSLSLINCEIPQFNVEIIHLPASIEKLSFSGTPIKKFHLNLGTLVELDLTNTNITTITTDMFSNIPKLTYINFSHNKIEQIEDKAFEKLNDLTEINLSNNKLRSLPNDLFSHNQDLVTVDLSSNPLRKVKLSFSDELEKLVLSNCNLVDFNDIELESLSYLDLSHNNLKYLSPGVFMNMPSLEYIDLSFNNLTVLYDDVFLNNPNLLRIILDENPIEKLPKFKTTDESKIFSTSIFSCVNCDTMIDSDTFDNMPSLVTLRLAGNQIENIGKTFQRLRVLVLLDLSDNEIYNITSDAFTYNSALRTLNLSLNSLSEIDPAWFENNKMLRELDVSYNKLTTIWKQVTDKKLQSILEINTSNNLITHILIEDLQVTPNIQILNITGNFIGCDKQFDVAIMWLHNNNVLPGKELTKMPLFGHNVADIATTNKVWLCEDRKSLLDGDDSYTDFDYDYSTDSPDNNEVIKEEDDINFEIDELTPKVSEVFTRVNTNQYFWPILVFFITAIIVLLVAANLILFVLRQRGNIGQARPITMPRIKIAPILQQSKMKKHSGSVYKPLSEENIYTSRTDVPNANLL